MKNILVCLAFAMLSISFASAITYDSWVSSDSSASADANSNAGLYFGSNDDKKANDTSYAGSNVNLRTNLDVSSDALIDLNNGQVIRVYLSNGAYADIKIMPEQASARAIAVMNASCGERNCSVELRERNEGRGEVRAVYEVEAYKESKLFGFINKDMKVKAEVDAETGEVIEVNKPWWAVIAVEAGGSA